MYDKTEHVRRAQLGGAAPVGDIFRSGRAQSKTGRVAGILVAHERSNGNTMMLTPFVSKQLLP